MADSPEVARAFITIIPTTKGARQNIADDLMAGSEKAGVLGGKAMGKGIESGLSVSKIAIGNMLANIATRGFDALAGSLNDAIARVDTLNNFPKVMTALGYSAESANNSIGKIKKSLDGLPSRTQDVANFVQQLTATMGDLDKATDVGIAFNNMMLAGGASTAKVANAQQMFNSMLASGKPSMERWNALVETAPGQMDQLAKAMLGSEANAQTLREAINNGTVSFDDMLNAIVDLNTSGSGNIASFEQQARDATGGIGTAIENFRSRITNALAEVIDTIGQENISSAINGISSAFSGVGKAVAEAYLQVKPMVDEVLAWIANNGDLIVKAAGGIMLVGVGFKVMQGASTAVTSIKGMAETVGSLAARGAGAAGGLMATAAGETAAGTAATASATQILAAAVAIVALGAGVALAALGLKSMAEAAVMLAEAGAPAIGIMVGMVGVIAGLAAGAALLGPALTAGAIGMVAFGGAVLMAGAGIAIAAMGIAQLADRLPTIAKYGATAAVGLAKIGAACLTIGAGGITAAAGLGGMALAMSGASLAVGAFGFALGSVPQKMTSLATASVTARTSMSALPMAMNATKAALVGLSSALTTAKGSFSSFSSSVSGQASSATRSVQNMANSMSRAVNGLNLKPIKVKLGKLPHFSWYGYFDAETGAVPYIDVKWYAKGGIFSSPQVIGVGDASTPEVVTPLADLGRMLDDYMGGGDAEIVALLRQLVDKDSSIYLDGDVLVGQTIGRTDRSLGSRSAMSNRGVAV